MRKPVFIGVAVLAGAGAVAAPASAKISVKINPATPIVDDNVKASFKTDRNLKPGYHYQADLVAAPGPCASWVQVNAKSKPKKGKTVSFTFDPRRDEIKGGPEWCQGKAKVVVYIVRDGDDSGGGSKIGSVSFRFVAKP